MPRVPACCSRSPAPDRSTSGSDQRPKPTLYRGYADGEGFRSSFTRMEGPGHRATGAVDRYCITMSMPGPAPGTTGDPEKQTQKQFATVTDDLRGYCKR